ncbi:MAG: hypothetical protein R3F61_17520 [Myxococcota bacterium]
MNAAVLNLPDVLTGIAPELIGLALPDEHLADCARCPMAGQPFHPSIRCCTYEPALPNFLAGRALSRGDLGSERVRARIERGIGLGPLGIQPDPAWSADYIARRETDFGRNADWRCPYWVEGPLSCSIWPDRNAVCRSWHCRHTEGVRGHRLWSAVRKLAAGAEQRVSAWCAEQEACPAPGSGAEAWVAYFVATARHAEQADAQALRDADVEALREAVRVAFAALRDAPPEVLGVEVKQVTPVGDEVELVGYTPWYPVRFPTWVFALLAAFDGERTRDEAVQLALRTDARVDPAWVRTLWDVGILRAREDGDDAPWGLGGPDLSPEQLQSRYDRSDR